MLVFLAGAGLIALVVNLPLAAELGKRAALRAAGGSTVTAAPEDPPADTTEGGPAQTG